MTAGNWLPDRLPLWQAILYPQGMIVHACAPTSIFEIGAWTDTAFAEHGAVFSCAADYCAHVTITHAGNSRLYLDGLTKQYPGLDAFFHAAAHHFGLDELQARITVDLSPAVEMGVFAAGAVALTGGLASLAERPLTPRQIAAIAHRIFSEEIGYAGGIQQCMTAALGGIGWYDITPYPRVFPQPYALLPEELAALEARLLLAGTGRSSRHGAYARMEMRCESADSKTCRLLWSLRALPWQAADALERADYVALGTIMQQQSDLLRQLNPETASPEVRHLSMIAHQRHAYGTAVNATGSQVMMLCEPDTRAKLEAELQAAGYPVFPIHIDPHGLRVWREEHSPFLVAAPKRTRVQAA